MSHSDGGKGSGRRKEDASKVRDNWDLIFGAKKKKYTTMNGDNEYIEDDEDDEEQECSWCHGCGEGDYDGASCRKCHGTGVEPRDDDYDDI
jgi:hypothetical protein